MVNSVRVVRSGVGWRVAALAVTGITFIACGESGGGSSAAGGPDAGTAGDAGRTGGGTGGAGVGGSVGGSVGGTNPSGGDAGASSNGGGNGGAGASSGGAGQGGRADDGGAGGDDAAGAGGSDGCELSVARAHGTRARSSGFSGTLEQYGTLYNLPCNTHADCATPCRAVGGTEEMCAANYCRVSTPNYCLPATIWTYLDTVSTEGTDAVGDSAALVVWPDPYRDFLLVDEFELHVPESAKIVGIKATIRRAGGGPDEAADGGVHLLKNGVMTQVDRSTSTPWSSPDLVNVDYGGGTDLWSETWTSADVNAGGFGVAVSARYPEDAGSGRAYIDAVFVEVSYRTCP